MLFYSLTLYEHLLLFVLTFVQEVSFTDQSWMLFTEKRNNLVWADPLDTDNDDTCQRVLTETWRDTFWQMAQLLLPIFLYPMMFFSPSLAPSPSSRTPLIQWREWVHYPRWDAGRKRGRTKTSSVSIFWQTWKRALFWHACFGMKLMTALFWGLTCVS